VFICVNPWQKNIFPGFTNPRAQQKQNRCAPYELQKIGLAAKEHKGKAGGSDVPLPPAFLFEPPAGGWQLLRPGYGL